MKQNIFSAIKLTVVLIILCVGVYSALVLGIAKILPDHGRGEVISDKEGKSYYANIGQKFDRDNYFNSRPSAVEYNASGSGGSNKGPTNPAYLKEVSERVKAQKEKNFGAEIPVDMVTASGSGLDPDISVYNAIAQAKRIAVARNIQESIVLDLINSNKAMSLFGPERINVLKLNIELDKIK